ncbi:MAG TPA: amino acid racemase [Oleiagrimonas sp.]|nr:amino acid racemase [Oleiagrimonas sp.]
MNDMVRSSRTLGVLGGMGPAATVDVLDKIVRHTPAARDQDHIPILVRCVPQIPDRSEALLGHGASPAEALAEGARRLRQAGAELLAIACNTAHHWYPAIHDAFDGPVVHIAEAVIDQLRHEHARTIGVMATSGTMASGFYRHYIEQAGYAVLEPLPDSQADDVNRAIACVKAGDRLAAMPCARRAADALFDRGAEQVVLACTELPLALTGLPDAPLLDANDALARACVRAACEVSVLQAIA